MTRRVMAAVAAIFTPRDDGAHVHFHRGPQHQPTPASSAAARTRD